MLLFLLALAASAAQPPLAPEIPHALTAHGDVRQDPYYWMHEKTPRLKAYLRKENAYAEARIKSFAVKPATLLKELKSHVRARDESAPHRDGAFEYFERTVEGREFPLFLRQVPGEPKTARVILDGNQLARGRGYLGLGAHAVSDDDRDLAYSVDETGGRTFVIYIKDLTTGRLRPDRIRGSDGAVEWSADGRYLFYVKADPKTLRARWAYRHRVGSTKPDDLIFEEPDPRFNVELGRTLSNRLILLNSWSFGSNETRYLPAARPLDEPKLFQARRDGVIYAVYDGVDRFFVRTNDHAETFRLATASLEQTDAAHWTDVLPGRPDVHLSDVTVFASHVVVGEKVRGLTRFRILPRKEGRPRVAEFDQEDFTASFGVNAEYGATAFRFSLESMAEPERVIDEDLATGRRDVKHTLEVPGFDARAYETKRLWVRADDGAEIPVSLVYRKGLRRAAKTPLLLYGYGAYGDEVHSLFSRARLPLLDRGFVFAVAHVRGGGELGRPWYLAGKLDRKKTSFTDFLSVARRLIKDGWTSTAHLYAQGESAGGLLVGAAMNSDPSLFRGVIAKVPFVDVLTTMLDETLPLTADEYFEWGNPKDESVYEYIKSYSPYDNVKAAAYPELRVTAGWNDTNVGVWEPAKWVARLRRRRTNPNALTLLTTEFATGHEGKNGRYGWLDEIARDHAFLLELEGRAPAAADGQID